MTDRSLVTGGAGFIGSHLVDRLVAMGHQVVVLDNLSTGRWENLAQVMGEVELVEGDIRDTELCRKVSRGCRAVFHQAALGSVPRSIEDPATTHEVNATGTVNMLRAAREEGVERFVFASSSSVYGDTPVLPKVESMRPLPLSPYASSKLACEAYCMAFAAVYGLGVVSLRYFNVFGPRQSPQGPYAAVIPRFFERLSEGRPVVIYGDGNQTRDFTFVENAVSANILAAERASEVSGQVFNVATASRVSINTLYREIAALFEVDCPPEYLPARPGDVLHSQADISLAERMLSYQPKVGLQEGLRRIREGWR
ncbi:MAG: SDR family oxidoreductase [Bradymonadales bacterium]|nr:SDR family oxidoreductase [Bradymonadales bacterium]